MLIATGGANKYKCLTKLYCNESDLLKLKRIIPGRLPACASSSAFLSLLHQFYNHEILSSTQIEKQFFCMFFKFYKERLYVQVKHIATLAGIRHLASFIRNVTTFNIDWLAEKNLNRHYTLWQAINGSHSIFNARASKYLYF